MKIKEGIRKCIFNFNIYFLNIKNNKKVINLKSAPAFTNRNIGNKFNNGIIDLLEWKANLCFQVSKFHTAPSLINVLWFNSAIDGATNFIAQLNNLASQSMDGSIDSVVQMTSP